MRGSSKDVASDPAEWVATPLLRPSPAAATNAPGMEVNMVAQRTGLSEDKGRRAVDTVEGFSKERAPAGLSGQIDSLVAGGEGANRGGIASRIGGMFGKTE